MKAILLSSIAMMIVFYACCQNITYKDIIGTSWTAMKDSGIIYISFTDSSRYYISVYGADDFARTYQLDTTTTPTTLLLGDTDNWNSKPERKMIRIEDSCLVMQGVKDSAKKIKWKKNKRPGNTDVYVRFDPTLASESAQ